MKTLESYIRITQKEKCDLTVSNGELTKKCEAQNRTIGNGKSLSFYTAVMRDVWKSPLIIIILDLLHEQIENMNGRNSTLSKKCSNLMDDSKKTQEKWSAN